VSRNWLGPDRKRLVEAAPALMARLQMFADLDGRVSAPAVSIGAGLPERAN
jgi:hypothetical protein